MAGNIEGHRGRRGRWLVLAVLLAVGAWVVRSQRSARSHSDTAGRDTDWPPPRPVDTGVDRQLPGEGVAATPAPQAAADPAPRRPSPRPRPAPTP